MESTNGTQVSIFGQTYHIQGGGDPEYAREVARLVDEKMNLIAAQVQSPDSFRVAVLAALHLADQCLSLQKQLEEVQTEIADRSHRLASLLDSIEGSEEHSWAAGTSG